jgi:hypothetical protein
MKKVIFPIKNCSWPQTESSLRGMPDEFKRTWLHVGPAGREGRKSRGLSASLSASTGETSVRNFRQPMVHALY